MFFYFQAFSVKCAVLFCSIIFDEKCVMEIYESIRTGISGKDYDLKYNKM